MTILRRLKCFFGFHWRLIDAGKTAEILGTTTMKPGMVINAVYICGWCKKELK